MPSRGWALLKPRTEFVYPPKSDDHDQDDEQAPTTNKPAATPQDTTASDGAADADIEEADERSPEDDANYPTNLEEIENLLEIILDSVLPLTGLDECLTTAEHCREMLDQVIARLKDKVAEVEPDSLSILEEE